MKKSIEPKTVGGRDGWRATLECANAEAQDYLFDGSIGEKRMTTKELIDSAYRIGRDHADCKLGCEAQVALVELEQSYLTAPEDKAIRDLASSWLEQANQIDYLRERLADIKRLLVEWLETS